MTPTAPATPAPRTPAADRFAIGWRDVMRTLPDGSTVWEQIPLTLDDALHPQEDDKIMTNTVHNRDWLYLRDVIQSRVAHDATALVLCDTKLLWEDGIHHSPDVALIFGVNDPHKFRGQFDVVAEGQRPRLILEVVSPNTRVNDVETKLVAYHHYQVPAYVIVDRADEDSPPQLIGYEYRPGRYRQQAAEDDGRLWLGAVGIFLGVRDNRVVAYDGETGAELGDYTEVSAALAAEQARADAETQRADAEKQRADAAEARARQLEAELRGRQGPPGT